MIRFIMLSIFSLSLWAQVLPMGAGMPVNSVATPGWVQSCNGQSSGSNTTATCTFGANITAGDFLRVCFVENSGGSPVVTWGGDTGSFVTDVNNFNWFTANVWNFCGYTLSASGGQKTITAYLGGQTFAYTIVADEFSNVGPPEVMDYNNVPPGGSTLSTNTIYPQTNGDLIVGDFTIYGTSLSASSPWTKYAAYNNNNNYQVTMQASYIQTTAAPVSGSVTIGGSGSHTFQQLTAFRPKGVTPAGPLIQSCTVSRNDGGTLTCTFPVNITAGNLLVACSTGDWPYGIGAQNWGGDSGTWVVDAGISNEWSGSYGSGNHPYTMCAHILSAGGGGNTITITGGGQGQVILAAEFHLSGTVATDGGNWNNLGTGTSWASNSITTTSNGDLVVGTLWCWNATYGTEPAPGSGWSVAALTEDTYGAENFGSIMVYRVQPSAGAITSSATYPSSMQWMGTVAAYK